MRVVSQDGKLSFDDASMFLRVVGSRVVASNSMDESKTMTMAQYRTTAEAVEALAEYNAYAKAGAYIDDDGAQQVVAGADTVSFAQYQFPTQYFTITFVAGDNGTLTGTTTQIVAKGDSCTAVTAVAGTGFVFQKWSNESTNAALTITNVQADATYTASFIVATFDLTYTAGAHGTLTGDASQTVEYGEDGTEVTAVPATGYDFEKWSDDVMTAARTDTNVTADVTVEASFTIQTFTLTYTAGENGSITGTSPQTVNYGANGSAVTAVAGEGYVFEKWSDDVMTAERTDENVTADITVTASFVLA